MFSSTVCRLREVGDSGAVVYDPFESTEGTLLFVGVDGAANGEDAEGAVSDTREESVFRGVPMAESWDRLPSALSRSMAENVKACHNECKCLV